MAGDSEERFGNKTLLVLIPTRCWVDSGVKDAFQVTQPCQLANAVLMSWVDAQPKD